MPKKPVETTSGHAACPHQYVVTDSMTYGDTAESYKELTDFLPFARTVTRTKALALTCTLCEDTKRI